MSQTCSQSNIHRNPAHAPPAAEEPTRYRTSEESGMQKDQHNTQSPTALLREEPSVNTLETNSLCCAAAGVIASSSSTPEALIPHEKLREAATPNATLTAQNRPPAQLAVGYKTLHNRHPLLIFRSAVVGHARQRCFTPVESRDYLPCFREFISTMFKLLNIVLFQITRCRKTIFYPLSSAQSFRNLRLNYEDRAENKGGEWFIQQTPKRMPHFRQSSKINHVGRTFCQACSLMDSGIRFIRYIFREMKSLYLELRRFLCLRLPLQLMRALSNEESDYNCSYRTKGLNPSRCILLRIKIIKQYKKSPSQGTDRQKQPHHPHSGRAHKRWKFQNFHSTWSHTVRRSARLPIFAPPVHGRQCMTSFNPTPITSADKTQLGLNLARGLRSELFACATMGQKMVPVKAKTDQYIDALESAA